MKFMKQVGDGQINLEEGTLERDAQTWSDEYVNKTVTEEGDTLAQSWANELTRNSGNLHLYIYDRFEFMSIISQHLFLNQFLQFF